MGIFDRIGTILRANINDLVDRAEDPELMLNQIIRDMAEQINEARGQVAGMLAQQKELEAEVGDAKDKAQEWESKAEMAVRANKDALAREALQRKNDLDSQMQVLNQQLEAQTATVNKLKEQLQALQEKYERTVSSKDTLIARHKAAAATQQVSRVNSNLNSTDYSSDLSRMEERIRSEEARASADTEMSNFGAGSATLDDQFNDLQTNSQIDDQLAQIKQRMGMSSSSGNTSGTGSSGSTGSSSSTGSSGSGSSYNRNAGGGHYETAVQDAPTRDLSSDSGSSGNSGSGSSGNSGSGSSGSSSNK